jgi:hypothetical protein
MNVPSATEFAISGAGLAFIIDRLIAFAKAMRTEPPRVVDSTATLENIKAQLDRLISSEELQGDVLREVSASLAVLVDRKPNSIRPFLSAIDRLRDKPEVIIMRESKEDK